MRNVDDLVRRVPRALLAALAVLALTMAPAGTAAAQAEGLGYERCEGTPDAAAASLGEAPVVPEGVPPTLPPGITTDTTVGELVGPYDIALDVAPDGSMAVHETIVYGFGPNRRHGIFRTLSNRQRCDDRYDRVYPVSGARAASPSGAPAQLSVEDLDGGVAFRVGDPDVLVGGEQTYELDYRVDAVVTPFDDHVELYWNVVGTGWQVGLADVGVTVAGPAAPLRVDCFTGPVGSTERCDAMAVDGDVASFGQIVLGPGEGMTVAVAYPLEAFDLTGPVLEERWSLQRAFEPDPAVLAGASALAVLGLGGVVLLAWRNGRDHQLAGSHVDAAFAPAGADGAPVPLFDKTATPVEFAPPDRLRPAQLSVVLDEQVGSRDVAATIVDLAVRRFLRIVEEGTGKDASYRLDWVGQGKGELLGYEQRLVDELFVGKPSVELDDLAETFRAKQQAVIGMVYDDAVTRGWFPTRPDKVRARWAGIGVVLVLLTGGLLAAAIAWTHLAWLAVPPVLASLLLLALSGKMPRRTPAGTGLLRRTVGFRHFIEDSEAPRAVWAEQRSIFTDYLPYAIAFDCADRWAETFEPLGEQALDPDVGWYVGAGAFSVHRLTEATSSFASTAATTLSSSPQSSGSSGFSGGGFSGGGGGGGGGGSW